MKKITLISLLAALLCINTSCDDYLDVNKNIDAPDYVEGYLYLAGVIQSFQGIYYDIRGLGPMTQMMGTSSTTYNVYGAHSYLSGDDYEAEAWRIGYFLHGMNLENLINQSLEAEEWKLAGIGYTIKAFTWDMMTKKYGDLPIKQAFIPGLLAHDYDYQEEIYPQVREWAYKAIECLEKEDTHNYGAKISSNDYIYKGDTDKWKKLAYAVIVRNLSSLSNKSNFITDYADELISCANKSFQTADDDATVTIEGGSDKSAYSAYNNFWGTYRGNLSRTYFQHEYAVQVMTGSVVKYDETTGEKMRVEGNNYYPFELMEEQIICDTLKDVPGHYDPRMAVKLGTTSFPTYDYINDPDSVKSYKFYGGSFTGTSGPIGTAPSFYGRNSTSSTVSDGIGRWLYRDNAPYIMTTCAEVKFCLAEAYWKKGDKKNALAAFKEGVKADLAFTARYIYPGTKGQVAGGDKISVALFKEFANEYASGPYVDGMTENKLTLSHIMMQKWVSLYPWGPQEAWVDMRKYHYDIKYSGEYPTFGDGWGKTEMEQKWDSDPTKVYKGLYLQPSKVQGRKSAFNIKNEGSPCYRIRPRYNSEYMWNVPSLEKLKPISGTADNYHCSMTWFVYPGNAPR